jgi:endonuclease/exonuclease/phosphatase family metal-dependent hydrolase
VAEKGPVIRVVSYNVHGCIGADGLFEPERVAEILLALEADFVALQEVEDRAFGGTTVSEFLADRLGMTAHYGSTLNRGDAPYGNLMLARHPAVEVRSHDISVHGGEPRGALEARFVLGDVRLQLIATHLGLRSAERADQARKLLQIVDNDRADIVVLAGDINEWRPRTFPLKALAGGFEFHSRARTFPARSPILALDRIYVSPGAVVTRVRAESTRAARRASDHLPLVCDIEVKNT